MLKSDPPVVIEETFDVDGPTVWTALTKVEQMRQWYFDNIPAFKPEVGFETVFTVENEGRVFPHRWRVTEVQPVKKISYDWRYDGYPGDAMVTFALSDSGNSTRLTLTMVVLEDFPDDIPEFTRESCIGGWEYFIRKRLKDYLAVVANDGRKS